MKKQIRKLSLNKKTISNLDAIQMKTLVGGNPTNGTGCNTKQCTQKCFTLKNCNTWTCARTGCGCL